MKIFNITESAKTDFSELIDIDNIGIIYEHVNIINNKRYIGQTIFWNDPYKRWGNDGSNYLRKTSDRSTKFSSAIIEFGWDSFEHNIIKYCTIKDLDFYEDKFIKEYDTINNGYNEIDNGRGMSIELRKSISENRKGKCIGSENPQWKKNITDETRKKLSESHIGKKDSIETRLKKSKAQIGHKVSEKQIEFIRNLNKGKIGGTFRAFGAENPASKKVGLFLDSNLIKIFESISDAAQFSGLSKSPYIIGEYCSSKREFNVKYLEFNLIWKFITDNDIADNKININIDDIRAVLNKLYSKKRIIMYNLDGDVLKEFNSSRDAADYVGARFTSHILSCCNEKRKTAHGYIWKFKEV